MELQQASQKEPSFNVDSRLAGIHTPLNLAAWNKKLKGHPDKDFASYILRGIENGFHIGVHPAIPLKPATKNMQSATQHPEVIDDYLQRELWQEQIRGPFPPHLAPSVHINRFGVIPKKHQPGKWRLITDLSFPEGESVNDAIDPALCSLKYVTVDQVARQAVLLGKGALIAKTDIKAAYRLVPVAPHQRHYLGMSWKNQIYVDSMLPFGLRSAPKIFNALADALEWCISKEGVEWIFHYLDDFTVLGGPGAEQCAQSLHILQTVCRELGVPLAPEKQEGPSTTLEFLGITIDTIQQELRLPEEKLARLRDLITQWKSRKSCSKRELESLLGVLQHACTVIPAGRAFLRQIINLLSVTKKRHHHVRLNSTFRSDLEWWRIFASHWNGKSLISTAYIKEVRLTSDVSGSWGCGAWWNSDWFQLAWDQASQHFQIAIKELIPVLIATVIWGKRWKAAPWWLTVITRQWLQF